MRRDAERRERGEEVEERWRKGRDEIGDPSRPRGLLALSHGELVGVRSLVSASERKESALTAASLSPRRQSRDSTYVRYTYIRTREVEMRAAHLRRFIEI